MDKLVLFGVVGLTSVGAYVVGTRVFDLAGAGLGRAFGRAVGCIGTALVLFVLNLGVAFATLVAVRSLRMFFIPLYIAADPTLLVLSVLQALVFEAWRGSLRD